MSSAAFSASAEAAGAIEQAALGELRHGVDQAGAADADGLDVADHAQVERAAVDLDDLDGAVGGAHAAADLRRLERRAGRRRRREDALLAAERDLAVRADVDEQAQPLVAVHAGREQAGHDVAADVGAERREHHGGRLRVDGDAEVGGAQARVVARGHDERRDADRLGVDAQRELGHRRVAGERDLVHLVRLDAALLADLLRQPVERLVREPLQALEGRVVEHRRGDARDDVGAERLLAVQHRRDGDGRAGREVEQRRDDGRGAEVEGDAVAALGRVAGLDVDQQVVDQHGA